MTGEREAEVKPREHLHDELIGPWCECGDGPFTAATWDDHRMDVLGELPLTKIERDLLEELDRHETDPDHGPTTERRDRIKAILVKSARESVPPLSVR